MRENRWFPWLLEATLVFKGFLLSRAGLGWAGAGFLPSPWTPETSCPCYASPVQVSYLI